MQNKGLGRLLTNNSENPIKIKTLALLKFNIELDLVKSISLKLDLDTEKRQKS